MRASLVLLSLSILTIGAGEPRRLDPKIQKLVEQIAAAPDAKTAARVYATLFKKPDRKLLMLKQVSQTGVALRAGWEEALLAGRNKRIFTKEMIPEIPEPTEYPVIKPEAAQRFLGFIEGRLRVQLPSWWEEAVRNSYGDDPLGPGEPKKGLPQEVVRKKEKGGVLLCMGHERVLLGEAVAEQYLSNCDGVAISANPKRCFIGFYNTVGYPYPLVCLNRETGVPVWEAKVWDWAFDGGGTSGRWFENVSLVEQGERVFVFGSGACFYIEVFDSKTGANEFRFANYYCRELDLDKK